MLGDVTSAQESVMLPVTRTKDENVHAELVSVRSPPTEMEKAEKQQE
jgi:hypothetical protein